MIITALFKLKSSKSKYVAKYIYTFFFAYLIILVNNTWQSFIHTIILNNVRIRFCL